MTFKIFVIIVLAFVTLSLDKGFAQKLNDKSLYKLINQPLEVNPQIKVGINPLGIDVNIVTNKIYITNIASDSISVIDGTTNTKIDKDIIVGNAPYDIDVNEPTKTLYVVNKESNSVSVISIEYNTKIKDITVGIHPMSIGINWPTSTVYVANSDSISVVDAEANEVAAGVKFQVNPINSGYIECNELKSPIEEYFYLYDGDNCIARPYQGFEFLSWEENIGNNSTQVINVSRPAYIFESIKDFFNIQSDKPESNLKITKFGTFTANFKELPPPLPPEYWATLFGVVVTAFISSWLTPTIIGWRKAKKYQAKLNDYQKELKDLYKDNKFDKNDISNLDRLREKVVSGYTRGDITKDQYDVLLNNVSIRYNEIFQNEIKLLTNNTYIADKINLIKEIESDLDDAYLKEKINEKHYNLLKEKISQFAK